MDKPPMDHDHNGIPITNAIHLGIFRGSLTALVTLTFDLFR